MSFPLQGNNGPTNNDPAGEGNLDLSQGNSDGINPAWNDVLGIIPKELHSQVTPHLANWDKGVQSRFEQVQSQYKPYEGYKSFVESQISPDDLRMGYGLLQAIYNEPLKVIKAMQESFGLDLSELMGGQGLPNQQDPQAPESPNNIPPEVLSQLETLKRQSETMGQILLKQREEETLRQQMKALDDELAGLKTKYGNFDDEMVLMLMHYNNMSGEEAVKRYLEHNNGVIANTQRPNAPQLLGTGSSIPEKKVDPRTLDAAGTKNLVAQMLKDAAAARQNLGG